MKLIYRATTYDYNPDKAPTHPFQKVRESERAHNLTYRGVTYRVDPNTLPTEAPVLPTTYNLIYRGITYLVTRTATGKVTVATQCPSNANVGAFSFPH